MNFTFINKKTDQMINLDKNSQMTLLPFDYLNHNCGIFVVSPDVVEKCVHREWLDSTTIARLDALPIDANPVIIKYYFKH